MFRSFFSCCLYPKQCKHYVQALSERKVHISSAFADYHLLFTACWYACPCWSICVALLSYSPALKKDASSASRWSRAALISSAPCMNMARGQRGYWLPEARKDTGNSRQYKKVTGSGVSSCAAAAGHAYRIGFERRYGRCWHPKCLQMEA